MPHLDEGTLHALLDGELDLTEVREIQTHLGSCVACGSCLQEVKQVLAEADQLVGSMELPAIAARPRPEPPRASPPRPPRMPEPWDEPPVLLLPESPDPLGRGRWLRGLKWAAVIAVIVVGGRLISNALRPGLPELPERDLTSASPTVPPAVVSPEESPRPQAPLIATRTKPGHTTSQGHAPISKAAKPEPVVEHRPVDSASDLADTVTPSTEDSVAVDSQLAAARQAPDTTTQLSVAPARAADSIPAAKARADASAPAPPEQVDEQAVRGAAAAALAELDRQRRRERANAATAALPPPAPARPEVPSAAESTPAPRTLEQRAQIYLRVGLDEASKQLGGPVHVIEGMSPQFIGLTRGQLVAGADPARPVVRVVYLDTRGRMILLDQQRVRSGQVPGAVSGNLRWTLGDVMLYLRGEPGPDVLRSLQARVR